MRDLPGPGIEPVLPALAGGFLTTVPLGKPYIGILVFQAMNNMYFLTFYLEIIIDSQELPKKKKKYREVPCTLHAVSPAATPYLTIAQYHIGN